MNNNFKITRKKKKKRKDRDQNYEWGKINFWMIDVDPLSPTGGSHRWWRPTFCLPYIGHIIITLQNLLPRKKYIFSYLGSHREREMGGEAQESPLLRSVSSSDESSGQALKRTGNLLNNSSFPVWFLRKIIVSLSILW